MMIIILSTILFLLKFTSTVFAALTETYSCHPPRANLLANTNQNFSDNTLFKNLEPQTDSLLYEFVAYPTANATVSAIFLPTGDPVYANGVGPLRANETNQSNYSVNVNSIFRVASLSKIFTSLEILILRDKGVVSLDTDITTYLPEFQTPNITWRQRLNLTTTTSLGPENRIVTLRQLLSHQNGLPREQPFNDTNQAFPVISTLPTVLNPYTYPAYTNLGFAIAAHIASQVENIPFQELIHRDILDPLGMNSTFYLLDQADDEQRSRLVIPDAPNSNVSERDYSGSLGAQGIYTSARDMSRLGQAILSSYHDDHNDNSPILKAESVREWLRPLYTFNSRNYFQVGMPWEIISIDNDIRLFFKVGGFAGYYARFWLDIERQFGGLIFATGSADTEFNDGMLRNITINYANAVDKVRQDQVQKFVGSYISSSTTKLQIDTDLLNDSIVITNFLVNDNHVPQNQSDQDLSNYALWPTSEQGIYRLVDLGQTSSTFNDTMGCLHQFAAIDGTYDLNSLFPIDLVYLDEQQFIYPYQNITLYKTV